MNYCIKELNDDLKPRERLKRYGVSYLSDSELLAIILRCGTKNNNVINLATQILNDIGGLNNISNISINSLSKIKGIGEVKAITLLAAVELGKRSLKVNSEKIKIINGYIVYDLLKYDYINVYQEKFIALFLDTKKNLIGKEVIFIGTINESTIHPREIFKSAIKACASSIIIVHNHPTGDSTPSNADIEITNKLMDIGKLLGILVIDHIIIGINNFYSFYSKERIDIDE